ncbi:hypothetical protein BpHYR1_015945 [Brachionus plicatilis]|uniref:Uncharacterized protein n=1 Tax=Brachionus plicatilis TaxID=10195 RepID=A0A3M7QGP9_BRAPC|nr:hypothetical protein BpHYR1_015945 [Brachionus plicatilis]
MVINNQIISPIKHNLLFSLRFLLPREKEERKEIDENVNYLSKKAYLKKLAIGHHSGGSTCATTWRLESPTAFYTSTTKLQKTFDSKEKIYFAKVAINFLVDQKKL